jgi:hypothetical protein
MDCIADVTKLWFASHMRFLVSYCSRKINIFFLAYFPYLKKIKEAYEITLLSVYPLVSAHLSLYPGKSLRGELFDHFAVLYVCVGPPNFC